MKGDPSNDPAQVRREPEGQLPAELLAKADRQLARRAEIPEALVADVLAMSDLPTQREHD